jgi:hypothetical protein
VFPAASLKGLASPSVKHFYWNVLGTAFKVRDAWRLSFALCDFFRERVTFRRAEEAVKRAVETREERFLHSIYTQVYERPASLYFKLLTHAGCAFGDLKVSVRRHGLEGALGKLASEGVYLTSEEFKGKREVTRGTLSFQTAPDDFQHASSQAGFATQSSGTSNRPVRTFVPLHYLAVRALVHCLFLSAHDLLSCAHTMYDGILPASGGINNLLMHSRIGVPAERWFARRVPDLSWRDDLYQIDDQEPHGVS